MLVQRFSRLTHTLRGRRQLRQSRAPCGHLWLPVALLLVSPASWAWKMEAGITTLKDTFADATYTSITFQQTYDVVPLVFVLPSDQGGDPSAVRVRSITTTGFQAAQVEPAGNDGPHVPMEVHYIAIEPGSHTLPNGNLIQAGSVSTTEHQRGVNGFPFFPFEGYERVTFPVQFPSTPAVVAQIQTVLNENSAPAAPAGFSRPWLTTAIDNVNRTRFDTALERSEANDGSIVFAETIAWLAMEDDAFETFFDNGGTSVNVTAQITPRIVRGWDDGNVTASYSDLGAGAQPVLGVSLNNRRDNDGGWVRYQRNSQDRNSVNLRGDEDRDGDSERGKASNRANEAGIIVFSRPFNASFGDPDILFMKRLHKVVSDPVNDITRPKAIPDAIVQYELKLSNMGDGAAVDVVIRDSIPDDSAMIVGDINGANSGPIRFVNGTPASGLGYSYTPLTPLLDDLEFSMDNGVNWNYQPTPDGDGADVLVTDFRVNMSGSFVANPSGAAPNFNLYFRVRVD